MVLIEGIFEYFKMADNIPVSDMSTPSLGEPASTASLLFSSQPVVIYLKYSVILLILLAVAYPYWKARRRMVALIDQIPGPPVVPWVPFLGHALLVLDLDRANFQYGTYSRESSLFLVGHSIFGAPHFFCRIDSLQKLLSGI